MTTRAWKQAGKELGHLFGERSATFDAQDRFVAESYTDLKRHKIFSMLVPHDLGGGGATLGDVCDLLRELGRHCASTALALSMHQHLVAATVFRHKQGQPGAKLLEKVAASEEDMVRRAGDCEFSQVSRTATHKSCARRS